MKKFKSLGCCILSGTLVLSSGIFSPAYAGQELPAKNFNNEKITGQEKSTRSTIKEYIPAITLGATAGVLIVCVAAKKLLTGETASNTNEIYPNTDQLPDPAPMPIQNSKNIVHVCDSATFDGTDSFFKEHPELKSKKMAILNLANYYTPGGGYVRGFFAQEEYLCHHTNLLHYLSRPLLMEHFYKPHCKSFEKFRHVTNMDKLKNFPGYTNMIYTTGVQRIKSITSANNTVEKITPHEYPKTFDVISVAAPNLSKDREITEAGKAVQGEKGKENVKECQKIYRENMVRCWKGVIKLAIQHNVKVLVLGALGCGAFCGNPQIVAEALNEVLQQYGGYFDAIIMPILVNKNSQNARRDQRNFNTFKKHFQPIKR